VIRIHLPFPPSVNALYGNGGSKRGRHKTKEYKAWQQLAGMCIRDSHRQALGPYSLSIALKRSAVSTLSDLTNREKAVSDLLVAHGVVKDDRYCQRMSMHWDEGIEADCIIIVQPFEQGMAT
jgi:crossover junction endodeoxyribonuclease RusA